LLGETFRSLDGHLHEGVAAAGFEDVRPAHYAVFRFLKPEGSRVTELAEQARMTKQSMGELVVYLEQRGYVERRPDPRDGRAKIVVLTEAGLRFAEAAVERVGEIEDALAERMGGQERLEGLAASLEELMVLSAEPVPTPAGSARKP
jgi:MarR family transcriptional regulator, temperature-dependent positive regulator of motility